MLIFQGVKNCVFGSDVGFRYWMVFENPYISPLKIGLPKSESRIQISEFWTVSLREETVDGSKILQLPPLGLDLKRMLKKHGK